MRKEEFNTLPKLVQQYLVYIEAIKVTAKNLYLNTLRTYVPFSDT